ncbi:MAG: DUF1080 domain-containing protein [Planctomycetes bacterium]|nr:DUF1080 domain-containing protein [Planctomycetota bacterium]
MKNAPIVVLLLAALAALAVSGCGAPGHAPAEPRWIPLFNGQDLSGWTPKITGFELGDNHLDTFRVEDGLLKVRYDQYPAFDGKFAHLFHDQEWSRYRMRVEYRFVGEQTPGGPGWAYRNSGVMVHGQPAASMALDQDFPVSIEIQLLGGNGEDLRPTANLCTPGTNVVMDGELVTRHCTDSSSPTFHGDQWVTVEFEVLGNQVIRHFVDGQVVLEYQQPQLDPNDPVAKRLIHDGQLQLSEGSISLQGESHPLDFRRIEILPL